MIEFEVKSKTQNVGKRKGQTVYYAMPKGTGKLSNKALVDRIVRETSLSAGDVSNALISISAVVCDALREGLSVDLADLGRLSLSVPSRRMDSPGEVTVKDALKQPRILFRPKRAMREAAREVVLRIDHSRVTPAKAKGSGEKRGKRAEGNSRAALPPDSEPAG